MKNENIWDEDPRNPTSSFSDGLLAFQDLCFLEAQENDGPLVEAKYKNRRKKMKILLIFPRKKKGLG
jgi:hypothetical protein